MKKKWFIALYKINEIKRLEINLLNQRFEYYIPKIMIERVNFRPKEEILFPGYIFVKTTVANYSKLRYTKGIKDIIKFGDTISHISNEDIKSIKIVADASKKDPLIPKLKIGQDVFISGGSFKGAIARICSLPSKERVDVLLTFLGARRRVAIPVKDLNL